jgi:hypothetical protein
VNRINDLEGMLWEGFWAKCPVDSALIKRLPRSVRAAADLPVLRIRLLDV